MKRPLVLCWVEATPTSSAPGTHLRGTLSRLRELGIEPDRVITESEPRPGRIGQAARIAKVTWRAFRSAGSGTLLARAHPLLAPVTWAWKRRGGRVCLLVQGRFDDVHDSYPWIRFVPFLKSFSSASIRHADAIAVPADGLRDDIAAVTGCARESIALLPNGVDTAFFSEQRPLTSQICASEPYALFVGNMAGWQGVDTILAARNSDQWPPVKLVFIGNGKDSNLVREAVGEDVQWLGRLPQDQVPEWMHGALVGLAPKKDVQATRSGISPFKIIEYAAAGLPVVTTALPSQAEVVEMLGNSILIEHDQPEELARAVREIYENPEMRRDLAEAGRLNAAQFDWRVGAATLHRLLSADGS